MVEPEGHLDALEEEESGDSAPSREFFCDLIKLGLPGSEDAGREGSLDVTLGEARGLSGVRALDRVAAEDLGEFRTLGEAQVGEWGMEELIELAEVEDDWETGLVPEGEIEVELPDEDAVPCHGECFLGEVVCDEVLVKYLDKGEVEFTKGENLGLPKEVLTGEVMAREVLTGVLIGEVTTGEIRSGEILTGVLTGA